MSLEFILSHRPLTSYVEIYPSDLFQPLQKISKHFPGLLEKVVTAVGQKFNVAVAINTPVMEGSIPLQALQERNISMINISDQSGSISLVTLKNEGIIVSQNVHPAWWDWASQTIAISYEEGYGKHDFFDQEDYQVQHLLFELHNASHTNEFRDLDTLEVNAYVRAFEKIEFQSTLETRRDLDYLAQQSAFDPDLNEFKSVYPDFELHYLFQQVAGHSYEIAKRSPGFDASPSCYSGTWKNSFDWTNTAHTKGAEALKEILKGHLLAIDGLGSSCLSKAMKVLMQGYQANENWATFAYENLVFFQEKYQQSYEQEPFGSYVLLIS